MLSIFELITRLGDFFSGRADVVFSLFQNEKFAPGLALVIIIFALILIVDFLLRRFIPARIELRSCGNRLKAFATWEDFSQGFDDFSAFMTKKTRILRHGWKEFVETIVHPEEDAKRPLWITVRPSVFMNMDDAEQIIGIRRLNGWASIFVGVGLLLTFLGLVAALFFAASAIRSATGVEGATGAMQAALVQLLNTATFKFWTSIAGLACSIVITLLARWAGRSLSKSFTIICRRIESLTQTVTPEFLASLQYRETREQTTQIKEFNGQLAFTIGQALENALSRAMPPVMDTALTPVADQLHNMASKISEMNQSALQSLTQEFGNMVTANAGTELRELAATLGAVREAISTTSHIVSGSGADMSRQVSEVTDELRSVMSSFEGSIGRMAASMDAATVQMREQSTESAGSISSVLLESVRELREAAEDNASQIKMAVNAIVEASNTARTGVDQAARDVGVDLQKRGREAAGELVNGTNIVLGGFGETVRSLQDKMDRLKDTLKTVEQGIGTYVQTMDTVNTRAKTSADTMSETTRLLNQATAPLARAEEGLSRSSQALTQSVSTLLNGMQPVQLTFNELKTIWAQYERRFREVDESLEKTLKLIMDNLNGNADSLRSYVSTIDSHLAHTVELLAGNISELEQVAENLKDTVQLSRSPTGIMR